MTVRLTNKGEVTLSTVQGRIHTVTTLELVSYSDVPSSVASEAHSGRSRELIRNFRSFNNCKCS